MKKENDVLEFDDQDAINFISKYIVDYTDTKIMEDDIQYVLDLICDYYEKNNLMEDDAVEEASIEEEDMFNFIKSAMKAEKIIHLDDEALQLILDGEYEYGKSIGIYTEE